MIARLERILYKLAQQHAPHLTPPGWDAEGEAALRLQTLARKLANYDVVVLVGQVPPEIVAARDIHIQDWVRTYGQMYQLLAQSLFPSFAKLNAYYADDRLPPVIVLQGEATPVMVVLSGYVTPYAAVRQPQRPVSDLELRGLMDVILEELEAGDLSRAVYDGIRETGVTLLKQMLNATIRHVSLTTFDKPVLETIQPPPVPRVDPTPPPGELPEEATITYELERLPEDNEPPTPTEQMFITDIPLTKSTRRRPPVPDLPDAESDQNP